MHECGSVNFKALRTLLHGIVTRLFMETDAEILGEEGAGRDAGSRPGRDKEAVAVEQRSSARELPKRHAEDSAPKQPRRQAEDSATKQPRGQAEESAPKQPREQVEDSAPKQPRGQAEDSAPKQPREQVEDSATKEPKEHPEDSAPKQPKEQVEDSDPEIPSGHEEESDPELPRGQMPDSASKPPSGGQIEDSEEMEQVEDSDEIGQVEDSSANLLPGQVEESAPELPRGRVEENVTDAPRGQVVESAPEFPTGQMEEDDPELPTGQAEEIALELQWGEVEERPSRLPREETPDSAAELPRRQVQDGDVSDGSNLMKDLFKENQDLKEKTCNLKKEVETLQNQITQLVTLEHVQSTLDGQRESIMNELKDYVSKTQLSDTIREFSVTDASDEAQSRPASPDLTQFSLGVDTQRLLMLIRQLQEKLDSLEARLKKLEGNTRPPRLSQQKLDPSSQREPMDINKLQEKLDSMGARVKHLESDIKTLQLSQEKLDPNSQDALMDINQLKEKFDSLEACVIQLGSDIKTLTSSQQQEGLIDQLWEKLDSLEAHLNDLNDDSKSPLLSQHTDSDYQGAVMDDHQLHEKLDSLEVRVTQLEGERDVISDEMVFEMQSLAEDPVDISESSEFGKELATSEITESQSSDRLSGTEQQRQPQSTDLRITVQKLQKDMLILYQELRSLRQQLKVRLQKETQDQTTESTSDMQGVVLQLQAKCDKLHNTTTQLMNEHMQEQSHIKNLYKTTKELDDKKADKTTISAGLDIKLDMEALEAKVHLCDATANKLDKNYHDLISIITDHEENCCLKIDEILTEMKLKVDPLKKQIKICQMNIQKALEVPKDDAAGFKKKLLTRYNCLSCDRAVDLQAPGPHMIVLPELPNLPPSKFQRRLKKGSNVAKENDTFAVDKKVFNEYQDARRSPIETSQAGASSLQKEKQWIPEESVP